ncbi:MAG: FTR1 family protein [Candidatus Aenigmarchaeota archaeon]|nr:FTR1 family protein [Candidatus Aenigmarchaeota archaeon]
MVFAPFLIMFREGLEAALIIAILIAYLSKTNKSEFKKYVWGGTALAVILSVIVGAILVFTLGELTGIVEQLFEGVAALLATIVLTAMIFWMARNAKNIKTELQQKIDTIISNKYTIGLAALAFIAVFKEGIETVLFLTASYAVDFGGTTIGIILGLIPVLVLAYLLLKGTVKLPLHKFFKYTGVLLIVFAAGLFGFGIHELMEAAEGSGIEFGWFGEHAYDINPRDATDAFHEKGAVGSVFKALVGYDGNPENLRVIGYVLYWLIIGGYFLRTYKGISFRKTVKSKLSRKNL